MVQVGGGVVGDQGGGVTIHAASVTGVIPDACDLVGSSFNVLYRL